MLQTGFNLFFFPFLFLFLFLSSLPTKMLSNQHAIIANKHISTLSSRPPMHVQESWVVSIRRRHGRIWTSDMWVLKKRFFFLWLGIGTARHRRRSHSTQCLCDAKHDEVDSLQLSRRKSRENKCHNRQESVVDLVEGVRLKGGIFQASRSETSRDVFVTVAHLSNKTFFVS